MDQLQKWWNDDTLILTEGMFRLMAILEFQTLLGITFLLTTRLLFPVKIRFLEPLRIGMPIAKVIFPTHGTRGCVLLLAQTRLQDLEIIGHGFGVLVKGSQETGDPLHKGLVLHSDFITLLIVLIIAIFLVIIVVVVIAIGRRIGILIIIVLILDHFLGSLASIVLFVSHIVRILGGTDA